MISVSPSYPETSDTVEWYEPASGDISREPKVAACAEQAHPQMPDMPGNESGRVSQTSGDGTIRKMGHAFEIRFDRWYPQPTGKVWDAIATAEGLAQWLADARLEPQPGGVIELDFGVDDGGVMRGAVARYQRPRVLQYSWAMVEEADAVVRWELPTLDEGTALSLTLNLSGEAEDSAMLLAKWHARLDALAAYLEGEEFVRNDASLDLLLENYREAGA